MLKLKVFLTLKLRVFQALKLKVSHRETKCFTPRNEVFHAEKQSVSTNETNIGTGGNKSLNRWDGIRQIGDRYVTYLQPIFQLIVFSSSYHCNTYPLPLPTDLKT